MSLICLFPGQGSQAKGMGADLFERYADWTAAADRVLGYSIRELCVDDPRAELGLTQFTQPALFVVNAMTYRAKREDGLGEPSYVAGHSLGEYNALLAAGCFDFATGLTMVKERGRLMSSVGGGGMAAVVGMEPGRIREILSQSEDGRRVDVANFNTFDQTVIAGPKDALEAARHLVRELPAADNVVSYALRLARATRPTDDSAPAVVRQWCRWGAGPRAGQALLLGAKAAALIDGRSVPSPDDVRAIAMPVLRHRMLLNFQAEADGVDADQVVSGLLEAVKP